jgi:hypothetical protein
MACLSMSSALNTKATSRLSDSTVWTSTTVRSATFGGMSAGMAQRPATASAYVLPAERGLAATATTSNQG